MSKLVFEKLLIADIGNKKAKTVEFGSGKNLLTSASNHLGKSMICKSLYHTLGADVFFSDVWKRQNALYALSFNIDGDKYTLTRRDFTFVLYDNSGNNTKLFKIKNLLIKLQELFKFKIITVGRKDKEVFTSAYPVLIYIPYYIDQENGWTPKTESFDKLSTMFMTDQKLDALYYHLGCLNEDYVEISLQLNKVREEKLSKESEADNCRKIIEYLHDFLEKNGDIIADEKELNEKITGNKGTLNNLLSQLEKYRNEIITFENEKTLALNEKETIERFIKREVKATHSAKDVKCPECQHEFSVDFEERFRKEYLLETIADELCRVVDCITKNESKIEEKNHKYVNVRNELKLLERTIISDEDKYNLYIKTKSARAMMYENQARIGILDTEIKEITRIIKILLEKQKSFEEKKHDANERYKNHLGILFTQLNISGDELIASKYNIGDEINSSGAYEPRAILAKYYAFLQTKREMAEDVLKFPIVVDSPRGNEQSKENSKIIMDFILNDATLDNQVIVATIDGKEYLENKENVNVVELTNESQSLLSSECYESNKVTILKFILDFGN